MYSGYSVINVTDFGSRQRLVKSKSERKTLVFSQLDKRYIIYFFYQTSHFHSMNLFAVVLSTNEKGSDLNSFSHFPVFNQIIKVLEAMK